MISCDICLCLIYYTSMLYYTMELLFSSWIIFHCIKVPHLLYQFLFDGHLGCFYTLAIVVSAVVNIGLECLYLFKLWFSGSMPRSGISRSYGTLVSVFLRNLCVLHGGCCYCSVTNSWPHELQHARLPCPSLCPSVHSNSCPLTQ